MTRFATARAVCPRLAFIVASVVPIGCAKPVDVPVPDLKTADPLVIDVVQHAVAQVTRHPGLVDAWNDLGRACYANGFPNEAQLAFSQSLVLNPDQPRTLYLRGLVSRDQYDLPAALADFDAAMAIDATSPHLRWRAAWVAMEQGTLPRGIVLADEALALAPDDRNALRVRARLHLESDTPEQGVAMLDQLLKRASIDRDVLWLQARLLRAAGEEDRAKQVAAIAGPATPVYGDPWTQWAMELKSNKRVETRRFIQRVEQGQLAEAAQVLANFNAHYPDDRDGFLLGTILLARQGNKQAAITGYEALIKAHPDWTSPLQQLGMLLLTRERGGSPPSKDAIAQAIDYLSRAIAIDEQLTTARGWLARAQSISRFWAPAIDNYHTCIIAQPLERAHRTNLASALVQYGQPDEALVILDEADALLGEPTPSALAARARAEFKRGRHDNAEAALLRLAQRAPRHPAIRQLRAAMKAAGS